MFSRFTFLTYFDLKRSLEFVNKFSGEIKRFRLIKILFVAQKFSLFLKVLFFLKMFFNFISISFYKFLIQLMLHCIVHFMYMCSCCISHLVIHFSLKLLHNWKKLNKTCFIPKIPKIYLKNLSKRNNLALI